MVLVRLTDVHQRQDHEDEGLDGDDQQVEDGPREAREQIADRQQHTGQRRRHRAGAAYGIEVQLLSAI